MVLVTIRLEALIDERLIPAGSVYTTVIGSVVCPEAVTAAEVIDAEAHPGPRC